MEDPMQLKGKMLSSTVIPVAVALGVAGAVAGGSFVISAAQANPCAAKRACNPCAAKRACSPCAAKRACNPCAAKNPCKARAACNPCAAKRACNPCAAKGACNPCAAKRACNPCAAKNPCNPCGANPCNPCGGAAAAELTTAEARSVYDCLLPELTAGYAKSGMAVATNYKDWKNYANQPYVSDTHGARYVNNYANAQGDAYAKYEDVGRVPVGAKFAKDSFVAMANGKVAAGPLFLMEKMASGFYEKSDNWRYTMIIADGTVFGTTKGAGAGRVEFCIECHAALSEDQDSLMLLPEEYRVN